VTEDVRPASPRLDVRVGYATHGLVPISVAERSLAAGPTQWLGLGAVAVAVLPALRRKARR
jgi:hypothetical protein